MRNLKLFELFSLCSYMGKMCFPTPVFMISKFYFLVFRNLTVTFLGPGFSQFILFLIGLPFESVDLCLFLLGNFSPLLVFQLLSERLPLFPPSLDVDAASLRFSSFIFILRSFLYSDWVTAALLALLPLWGLLTASLILVVYFSSQTPILAPSWNLFLC